MRLHHSAAHAGAESASGLVWPDLFGCNSSRQPKNLYRADLTPYANTLPIGRIIYYAMKNNISC
jgi:hypothetical protein